MLASLEGAGRLKKLLVPGNALAALPALGPGLQILNVRSRGTGSA